MRKGMATALAVILVGIWIGIPVDSFANEKISTRPSDMNKAPGETGDKKKDQECDKIDDSDKRNLCRAFTRESHNTEEQKKNRYANKDHSFYYCTLVKDKDKQTFCYAVVRQTKSMCGNIIDAKLEAECNAKVK